MCDCEFGVCNVNATSEQNKCTCGPGYTGDKCDQTINYCYPGKLLNFIFPLLILCFF